MTRHDTPPPEAEAFQARALQAGREIDALLASASDSFDRGLFVSAGQKFGEACKICFDLHTAREAAIERSLTETERLHGIAEAPAIDGRTAD